MKKYFLLLPVLFLLSGCANNYDAPTQAVNPTREYPAIVQPVKSEPVVETKTNTVITPTVDNSQVTNESPTDTKLSNDNSYVNVNGNQVHSPAYSNTAPAGATAICRDGTYSFSQHRSGTCSRHGGVSEWLN